MAGLTVEQLKTAARDHLNGDITGEGFLIIIEQAFADNVDADIAAKWLAEQILIVR